MMECIKIKKMLPDYSVGGLSKKNRNFVKQHIENCPDCINELNLLNKIGSLLDNIKQEEPPDFVWERIQKEIAKQSPTKTSLWHNIFVWFWKERIPTFAMSLGALILIAGFYFFVQKSPTESDYSFRTEIEQQNLSNWNSPFADRIARGMIVMKTELGDGNNEKDH